MDKFSLDLGFELWTQNSNMKSEQGQERQVDINFVNQGSEHYQMYIKVQTLLNVYQGLENCQMYIKV